MISQLEARARVDAACAHLDRRRPGWQYQIDLLTLDMQSPCRCIVGQLMNAPMGAMFSEGVRLLFPVPDHLDGSHGVPFGVDVGRCESHSSFQVLQEVWVEAIEARRLFAAVAAPERELVPA